MLTEDIPVGDRLRSLVLELHALLNRPVRKPELVRGLMWRAAALKAQLRSSTPNDLIRYLSAIERCIGRAYMPSPLPDARPRPQDAGRHAA